MIEFSGWVVLVRSTPLGVDNQLSEVKKSLRGSDQGIKYKRYLSIGIH